MFFSLSQNVTLESRKGWFWGGEGVQSQEVLCGLRSICAEHSSLKFNPEYYIIIWGGGVGVGRGVLGSHSKEVWYGFRLPLCGTHKLSLK